MTHEALAAVAEDFKYVDISGLYAGVGDGHTSAQSVMEKLVESLGGNESTDDDITEVSIPTQVSQDPLLRFRRGGARRGRRLGEAGPLLHAGARRTRSSGSSPAARAYPCTGPTAPTSRT